MSGVCWRVRVWLRQIFRAALLLPLLCHASESLNIAVTASFKPVLDALAAPFAERTGIQLKLSAASSGVLTQQILAGAPFDLFFSADAERPVYLAKALGLPANRIATYALGTLVLVSDDPAVTSVAALADYQGKVVLANPAHAPYGVAAAAVLDQVGFQGVRVLANNVAQARQYLILQLASVGLVTQAVATDLSPQYPVDRRLYAPIVQQRLLLKPSPASERLLAFLVTPQAQAVLKAFGYQVPGQGA